MNDGISDRLQVTSVEEAAIAFFIDLCIHRDYLWKTKMEAYNSVVKNDLSVRWLNLDDHDHAICFAQHTLLSD